MLKVKYLLLLITCLFITGCQSKSVETFNKAVDTETTTDAVDIVSSTNTFFFLLMQDKAGDKRSVNWDGESASIIDDAFDSFDIEDGRSVSEGSKTYTADMLIECVYPADFEQMNIDEHEPDNCHFSSKDDDIFVQQISYSDELDVFMNDDNYKAIDLIGLREDRLKYLENYKTFVGIKEINGVKKAGYVLLFKSALADRSYKIEVYGLGNMSNINQEALFVMNAFEVLWY